MTKIHACPDCEKTITGQDAKRCRSCAAKFNWSQKEFRENRKCKYVYTCVDCGKQVSGYRNKRCQTCHNKYIWSVPKYREKIIAAQTEGIRKFLATPEGEAMNKKKSQLAYDRIKASTWNTIDFTSDVRKKMSESRLRAMSEGRDEFWRSNWENRFAAALHEAGIRYVRQYRINSKGHPYDFFLVDLRTIIEVDGSWWHTSDWAKSVGRLERDEHQTIHAKKHGFNVIRLSDDVFLRNHDLLTIIENRILKTT